MWWLFTPTEVQIINSLPSAQVRLCSHVRPGLVKCCCQISRENTAVFQSFLDLELRIRSTSPSPALGTQRKAWMDKRLSYLISPISPLFVFCKEKLRGIAVFNTIPPSQKVWEKSVFVYPFCGVSQQLPGWKLVEGGYSWKGKVRTEWRDISWASPGCLHSITLLFDWEQMSRY